MGKPRSGGGSSRVLGKPQFDLSRREQEDTGAGLAHFLADIFEENGMLPDMDASQPEEKKTKKKTKKKPTPKRRPKEKKPTKRKQTLTQLKQKKQKKPKKAKMVTRSKKRHAPQRERKPGRRRGDRQRR